MGSGMVMYCQKCRYEAKAMVGGGMKFATESEEILSDMQKGRYGKRFAALTAAHPDGFAELELAMARCEHCGTLHEVRDIRFCVRGEDGKVQVLRTRAHRCGKCHVQMRVLKNLYVLKCPKCGCKLSTNRVFLCD